MLLCELEEPFVLDTVHENSSPVAVSEYEKIVGGTGYAQRERRQSALPILSRRNDAFTWATTKSSSTEYKVLVLGEVGNDRLGTDCCIDQGSVGQCAWRWRHLNPDRDPDGKIVVAIKAPATNPWMQCALLK
jgi:hypothetical protein